MFMRVSVVGRICGQSSNDFSCHDQAHGRGSKGNAGGGGTAVVTDNVGRNGRLVGPNAKELFHPSLFELSSHDTGKRIGFGLGNIRDAEGGGVKFISRSH